MIEKEKLKSTFLTLLLLCLIIIFGNQVIKFVLGTSSPFDVVVSSSMKPTLNVGDLLIVHGVDPSQLKIGDIIVFHSPVNPKDLIVHRIIKIVYNNGTYYFGTKGDANYMPDEYRWGTLIPEDLVEGRVLFVIPYLGWLRIALDPLLHPPTNYILTGLIIIAILACEVLGTEEKKNSDEEN